LQVPLAILLLPCLINAIASINCEEISHLS
jgi:hypothetical protein